MIQKKEFIESKLKLKKRNRKKSTKKHSVNAFGLTIKMTAFILLMSPESTGAGKGRTEGQFVTPLLRVEEKKEKKISSGVCVCVCV